MHFDVGEWQVGLLPTRYHAIASPLFVHTRVRFTFGGARCGGSACDPLRAGGGGGGAPRLLGPRAGGGGGSGGAGPDRLPTTPSSVRPYGGTVAMYTTIPLT
jgi:hypothetical protein